MSSAARAKTAQPNNERSMHTIMKRRRILNMLGIMAAAVATAGCSSSMYSSSSPVASDDLYATHDRKALMEAEIERRAQEIAAEKAARAAAEAQREEAARQLAEYRESEDAQYDGILSDGYADSYEKRLRGFTPSEDEEPAPKTVYVSAYEPAYFNVTVIGDQVWVEPKYVSSLYGTWGSSVTVNLGLWGWGYPSWSWGPPTHGTPAGVGVPITDGDTPIMPAGDGVGVTPITTAGDGAAIIRTTIGEEEVLTTDITTEIRFTEDPGPDRAAPSRPSREARDGRDTAGAAPRPTARREVRRPASARRAAQAIAGDPPVRELPAASRQAIPRGTAAPRTVGEAAARRSATVKAAICRAAAHREATAAAAR